MGHRSNNFLDSSLTSSLSPLSSDHSFICLSNFSSSRQKPFKIKTVVLKSHHITLSPLPLPILFSHICQSSLAFNGPENVVSDKLEEYQDEEHQNGEESQGEDEDEIEQIRGSDSYSADDCRLYVGNLPYSITSSELSDSFSQAGQVRSVEIIYDKLTDRSRGFGFVTMGSIDEAEEAIRRFDGSQIGGRKMKVNFPEVPRGGEKNVMGQKMWIINQSFVETPHKIYVGNLGWGVSTEGLRDAFVDQPGFISAKVIYERETRRSRGFGFLSFSSAEFAQSALTSMNGVELEGRPLRLNMAAQRPRSNVEQDEEDTVSS